MDRKTRKNLLTVLFVGIILGAFLLAQYPRASQGGAAPSPKYIFIFLADGAGSAHLEIARQYNRTIHNEGLVISDKIMREGSLGLLTTHAADFLTTDSAAAATALAAGCKAKISAVGMCADGSVPKTVMEIAREKGMRIGLVTNSRIYDASPAAFALHAQNRKLYSPMVEQYLKLEPEVLLGGGRDQFLPRSHKGSGREDDRDIIASFKKRGYAYVSTKNELKEAKGAKVLGLFSLLDMSFEIDRDNDEEPSLRDMAQAAIRLLESGNRRGFVAFIENENVDTAGHLNDIAALIHEMREFDRAVGLAYEFFKQRPKETLILVLSDHETGGLGFASTIKMSRFTGQASIDFAPQEELRKLQGIRISLRKASELLGENPSPDAVDRLMREHFKGFEITPELETAIMKPRSLGPAFYPGTTAAALGAMVAFNTQAYWSTTGHTSQPVFVGALGVGAERFRGYQDNTDFGKHLIALLREKR